jgi:hypothetical protein
MQMSGSKYWAKFALAAFISAGTASMLYGDSFEVTYAPAGTQEPDTTTLCKGASTCWIGEETFPTSSVPTNANFSRIAYSGAPSGSITGVYSGALTISSANQYGGAGGTGYFATVSDNNYTLTLTASGASSGVPGVNYFGLWFSALDNGNQLQFYDDSTLLYTFTPALFSSLVGECTGSNPFCGNPNNRTQDAGEQFAFLNFYDMDGYFNNVVFTETTTAGFESDNHTVGYMDPVNPTGTEVGETPEPGSFVFVVTGLLALVGIKRQIALSN